MNLVEALDRGSSSIRGAAAPRSATINDVNSSACSGGSARDEPAPAMQWQFGGHCLGHFTTPRS